MPRRCAGVVAAACTQGKRTKHGKPQGVVSEDQSEAREGQAGRPGVAERFVVPRKPGNAGGGKGPQFKTDAIRGEGPRRLGNLSTPINGSEAADGVARASVKSYPRAGCGKSAWPVVCPVKAGMFSRRQTCRGRSQSPVVWIAEVMETETLKPIVRRRVFQCCESLALRWNDWIVEGAGPGRLKASNKPGRITLVRSIVSLRPLPVFIATHLRS